jgi:hypothetical protein
VDHNVGNLMAYIRTWSAFKRACRQEDLASRLEELLTRAEERLGNADSFRATTPLAMLAGRVK